MPAHIHRGEILYCVDNPAYAGDDALVHIPDGYLLVESGTIMAVGAYSDTVVANFSADQVSHHKNGLIIPGFIDTHIHFPQSDVIAAYGTRLLDWLETHTFPAESRFHDENFSAQQAGFFIDQLLRNGTTTALVFGSVHPQSVEAFFTEAQSRRLRMICGKVMMDRNAPEAVLDTPETSYLDSAKLIERWHGVDRLDYAVTPRFAPTSSDQQLAMAKKLMDAYPGVYLHTHISENEEECAWVKELFPWSKNYLDVYDHYGLLGDRSILAHGIHFSDGEWERLAQCGTGVSHCPTSNLFIGSGLFCYDKAKHWQVEVGLGTDVGGGDSFSLLRTINEAYKVQQLKKQNLSPAQCFYLATLGGARVLDLQSKVGSFAPGCEADFVVLDYGATPLIQHRIGLCKTLPEKLFAMMMMGDDRAVRGTYILGEKAAIR